MIGRSDECQSVGYISVGLILAMVAAGGVVGEEASGLLVSVSDGPELGEGEGLRDDWWLRKACSASAFLAALCWPVVTWLLTLLRVWAFFASDGFEKFKKRKSIFRSCEEDLLPEAKSGSLDMFSQRMKSTSRKTY